VIGPALRRHLLALYIAFRHIPAADIAGIASGSVLGARQPDGTEWASIGVLPSSGVPLSTLAGFQDGGRYGIFTRAPGSAWRIAGLGGQPFGCGVGLPAAVRHAWHLPSCAALAGSPVPVRRGAMTAGTTADLAKIAKAQIGVSDNPPVTFFSQADDCNPYTALVGSGRSHGGLRQVVALALVQQRPGQERVLVRGLHQVGVGEGRGEERHRHADPGGGQLLHLGRAARRAHQVRGNAEGR